MKAFSVFYESFYQIIETKGGLENTWNLELVSVVRVVLWGLYSF